MHTLFAHFDWIALGLVAFLALKGVVTGFAREFLQTFSIMIAVALASRLATPAAVWIQSHLHGMSPNPSLTALVCFVLLLGSVWFALYKLGTKLLRDQLPQLSPTGRVLGYLAAFVKYFVIAAIIVAAFTHTRSFHQRFARAARTSVILPTMDRIGTLLLNIPPHLRRK